MREPVGLLWSGGKDSALALHALQQSTSYSVCCLLTTVTEGYERISIHGVRLSLLEAQAESLRLPLQIHRIPQACSNLDYEDSMLEALNEFPEKGITTVAVGDIFLEDVRRYREDLLKRAGMKGIFPLWQKDTRELVMRFLDLGFKATTTCVDTRALQASLAGRPLDHMFLAELPAIVDPCGENGEFHTFVHDGPLFKSPVAHSTGEVVVRDARFSYCDLLSPT